MAANNNYSNSDTCYQDKDMNIFLRNLLEEKSAKVISILLSTVGTTFLILLTYGIIWYEHFGSDKQRILVNKFVSSLCWTVLEWLLFIQPFDIVSYIVGPMPESICLIEVLLRNSIPLQMLLIMNGIAVTRYVFIFWLKNPTAFKDDFWSFFLNMWIVGLSLITEACCQILGPQTIYFYLCKGKQSAGESPRTALPLPQQILTLMTLALQILIILRIQV
jgi:hypothetical protein